MLAIPQAVTNWLPSGKIRIIQLMCRLVRISNYLTVTVKLFNFAGIQYRCLRTYLFMYIGNIVLMSLVATDFT